jgi:hypothetical protein
MEDKLHNFYKQIDQFNVSQESITLDTSTLNSQERLLIHSYCEKGGLESQSQNIGDGKIIKVFSLSISNNKIEKSLNKMQIKFFVKNLNLPIPYCSSDTIEYYLALLDKYYDNCLTKYKQYEKEMLDNANITYQMKKTSDEAVIYIKEYAAKHNIKNKKLELDPGSRKKGGIYNGDNINKRLVSFDIKKGNFTVSQLWFEDMFPLKSWYDFISQFTESEFVRNSKRIREVIFGESKMSKLVHGLQEHEINAFFKFLLKEIPEFQDLQPKYKSGDELVFDITDLGNDIDEKIHNIIKKYPKKIFHVELFTLKKMPNTKFYYKLFGDGTIIFRMIPKQYIMQAIKHIENKPMTQLDLTATDNHGIPYVYTKSIFDL